VIIMKHPTKILDVITMTYSNPRRRQAVALLWDMLRLIDAFAGHNNLAKAIKQRERAVVLWFTFKSLGELTKQRKFSYSNIRSRIRRP
jgi:hypothetical protein